MRSIAKNFFLEALQKIRVPELMLQRVTCADGLLHIGDLIYSLQDFSGIMIIAIGKASVPMCNTFVPILTPALNFNQTLEGIAVGVSASVEIDPRIHFLRGGHPLPDHDSAQAADAVLQLLAKADKRTLVLFLISGGSSAMIEKPLDETLTREDVAGFHSALVRSGLPITQMNTLRKHFSQVKGGRLAVAAQGATQCTLLISDVPANALHIVGSGPSLPDPTTLAECRAIIHGGLDLPPRVLDFFNSPQLMETPKPDHVAFQKAVWLSLVSSDDLCASAASLVAAQGFVPVIDNTCDDWDYRAAARYLIDRLAILQQEYPKVCLISAGEVTVTLNPRHGLGGRNQQFTLECARLIAAEHLPVTVLSGGSDGVDGNSAAAGAVADDTTAERAASLGLNLTEALESFNSSPLFDALGDSIHTGPTGNNVRDLRLLFAKPT
jgi:glycerate 2-kinase